MRKIYYVNSNKLTKASRDEYNPYTMVEIVNDSSLGIGNVLIDTYVFDIMCAYAQANHINSCIIKKNIIKELNWDNVLNDLKEGSIHRKYWYKYFLYRMYNFDAGYNDIYGDDDDLIIYKDHKIIGSINTAEVRFPDKTLYELEMELNYMIDHNIDKDKAEKLLDIVKNDPEVRMSNEKYFRLKYGE